ncbi:MAG: Xaa-Pro peptidase family protein [Acidobacteria bacterium]|nr:Xaa-Pro peptidase family protein [Acidobacteriota bacterium]
MPQPTSDCLTARHAGVRAALAANTLDALVVVHLPNVRYLTGFAGSTATVVLTAAEIIFITDGRYLTEVAADIAPNCPGFRLVKVDPTYDATLARVLVESGVSRVGFEAAYLTVKRFDWLSMTLAASVAGRAAPVLVPAERLIEAARIRKDATECDIFRRAGALLDAVAADVLASVHAGIRECDLAADIDHKLRRGGFEKPSFDTIVASGPHAAMPHARPDSRVLQAGDLVVLDFGGVYDGYCVDLTRTVSIGPPDLEARRLYAAVSEAHEAAGRAARPGAPVSDVDEAARAVLERHGLGAAFSHATGHGLGLEIHEEPRVGPRRTDIPGVPPAGRDDALEPGIVFTIEPGAYVPGVGGVRIEDDVLVTGAGVEWLTHVPRELRVV